MSTDSGLIIGRIAIRREVYNYFRTYDPSTGRYLESDPIGLSAGPNTYSYVGASPLSFIDALGLKRVRECFETFIRKNTRIYSRSRSTLLFAFNWPGAEIGVGPGLDPGRGGQGPIRPQPDITPERLYVDRYKKWRIDVYEIIESWEEWIVTCQSWDVDDCTNEPDYASLAEGRNNAILCETMTIVSNLA